MGVEDEVSTLDNSHLCHALRWHVYICSILILSDCFYWWDFSTCRINFLFMTSHRTHPIVEFAVRPSSYNEWIFSEVRLKIASTIIGITLQEVLHSTIPIVLDEIPTNAPLTGCNPIIVPSYFSSYWCDPFILMLIETVRAINANLTFRIALIVFQSASIF